MKRHYFFDFTIAEEKEPLLRSMQFKTSSNKRTISKKNKDPRTMPTKVLNVKVSDTTGDDSSNSAKYIKDLSAPSQIKFSHLIPHLSKQNKHSAIDEDDKNYC